MPRRSRFQRSLREVVDADTGEVIEIHVEPEGRGCLFWFVWIVGWTFFTIAAGLILVAEVALVLMALWV